MYLMFMTGHPNTPIPIFYSVQNAFFLGNIFSQAMILISILGIVFFGIQHFRLLSWNLRQFFVYKKSPAYAKLKKSNSEVSLMALPLTLAMSINVLFIFGAVLIPGLWDIVEYLFPAAVLAFTLV